MANCLDTWTGMGTTILGGATDETADEDKDLEALAEEEEDEATDADEMDEDEAEDETPPSIPALTRFHLALRFWNQILTCASESLRVRAMCDRSPRLRYFLAWNSRSRDKSWLLEKAVLRLLPALLEEWPEPSGPLEADVVDSSPSSSSTSMSSSSSSGSTTSSSSSASSLPSYAPSWKVAVAEVNGVEGSNIPAVDLKAGDIELDGLEASNIPSDDLEGIDIAKGGLKASDIPSDGLHASGNALDDLEAIDSTLGDLEANGLKADDLMSDDLEAAVTAAAAAAMAAAAASRELGLE